MNIHPGYVVQLRGDEPNGDYAANSRALAPYIRHMLADAARLPADPMGGLERSRRMASRRSIRPGFRRRAEPE
jgi:hypothetical protein